MWRLTCIRMHVHLSILRTMQVHYQLTTLKKGNSSIADYFHQFTTLVDTLVAIDQPLNDFELISFLLAGLWIWLWFICHIRFYTGWSSLHWGLIWALISPRTSAWTTMAHCWSLNNNSPLLISLLLERILQVEEILAVAEVAAKTPLLHLVVALLPPTRKITEARGMVVAMGILHPQLVQFVWCATRQDIQH